MAYTTGWADLPLDLHGDVIARLPFPGDRARFAAVCRAWRSAARQLSSHLPWIVLPNGTFCTAGHDTACFSFQIPGFPVDTTCLGAAHDCWLALDCTDDVVRRTPYYDTRCRPDVEHKHTYMLHNPFSNITVPLPELDAIIAHIAETFEIRKVLMRSQAPDDVIAVTTNNWNYNIILFRSGKGCFVLDHFRVVDVAFLGDTLYGITTGEELLAFHFSEDEDGRPHVTRIELVIKNPLARYYCGEFPWSWPQDVVDTSDEGIGQDDHNNGGGEVSSSNEEDPDDDGEEESNQEEYDNNAEDGNQEEEDVNEESDDDELADQELEDSFNNGDDMISDNEEFDGYADGEVFDRYEVPYEAKDEVHMGRYLVQSRSGELLLVRHQWQTCPYSSPFTRNVEVFEADLSAGKWVAASDGGLAVKGEAIFLSRSYSKCTRAHGGIHEGFVYYAIAYLNDVFDMTSCTTTEWPWQCQSEELTWLFPPELVI